MQLHSSRIVGNPEVLLFFFLLDLRPSTFNLFVCPPFVARGKRPRGPASSSTSH